jgi:hypothetical protein
LQIVVHHSGDHVSLQRDLEIGDPDAVHERDEGLYRAGQAGRKSVAGVAEDYVLPDCRQDLSVSPEHLVAPQIAFVVQCRADVPTTEHAFEGVCDPEPGTKSAPDAFVRVIHAVSIGRPGGRLKRSVATWPATREFGADAVVGAPHLLTGRPGLGPGGAALSAQA